MGGLRKHKSEVLTNAEISGVFAVIAILGILACLVAWVFGGEEISLPAYREGTEGDERPKSDKGKL